MPRDATMTKETTYKSSKLKRVFGVFIVILPLVTVTLSAYIYDGRSMQWWSWTLIGFGLIIGAINFHLSFIRPLIHKFRYTNMDDYRFVSGIPLFGTLIAVASAWACQGNPISIVIAFIILLVDTGGLPWFVISTWKDNSLWGNKI